MTRGTLRRAPCAELQEVSRMKTIERRSAPGFGRGLTAMLFLVACASACSGKLGGGGQAELPRECESFVAKYEHCLAVTIPSLPQLAKDRAAQTRAALEQEVTHGNLTALADTCRTNQQQLGACTSSAR